MYVNGQDTAAPMQMSDDRLRFIIQLSNAQNVYVLNVPKRKIAKNSVCLDKVTTMRYDDMIVLLLDIA